MRLRWRNIWRACFACLAFAGCSGGADPNSGIGAYLRLTNAQYISGELGTAPAADAPTMAGISIGNVIVFPGAAGRSLGGSAFAATSVLIGLEGDVGHWEIPTSLADATTPGAFLFDTTVSLSPLLPVDPATRTLIFRAVDQHGTVGPPMTLDLQIQASALATDTPPPLEVTLTWDTEADLDLKVRVPVPNPAPGKKPYVDVWNRSPVALPPVPSGSSPYTPDEIAAAGQLDFDSNAQCLIDGRRQEDVIFPQVPPPGTYEVRVDATSLCGQVAAQWHAVAMANGQLIPHAEAYGQVGDIDTQGSHGPATGTLAFTFTVPTP